MIFHALLPEVFALVPPFEKELDGVLVIALQSRFRRLNGSLFDLVLPGYLKCTYVTLWMKLDQKSLPFETDFPNFRPTERVYLGEILKHYDSHMRHC